MANDHALGYSQLELELEQELSCGEVSTRATSLTQRGTETRGTGRVAKYDSSVLDARCSVLGVRLTLKEPSVLTHCAFWSQPPLLLRHSFTSRQLMPLPVKPSLQRHEWEPCGPQFIEIQGKTGIKRKSWFADIFIVAAALYTLNV